MGVPNIELVLLSLMYASIIACILLLSISLSLLFLVSSSIILLFVLVAIDAYQLALFATSLINSFKPHAQLALLLLLCHALRAYLRALRVLKPYLARALRRLNAPAHRLQSLHHL